MTMPHVFGYLYWDPSRFIVNVPLIDRPLGWYGLLFAFGFMVGYFVMVRVFKRELEYAAKTAGQAFDRPIGELAYYLTDRLCWLVVAGTVVGARLGHVLFYDWGYYSQHPGEILHVWEGGLASHGGVVGIVLALFFFVRLARKVLPSMNLIMSLDLLAVGTLFACFCIRLGNFFNQEIVGTATDVPWAVIFGHPAEGGPAIPRHPVQLYEGFFYLFLFFVLYAIWNKGYHRQRPGLIIGLLFTLVFSWRFLMEFFKEGQGGLFEISWLQTGQVLSIPLVVVGLWLIFRSPSQVQSPANPLR